MISPGTVSKILWHFTGGPDWDSEKNKQALKPKSAKTAFDNFTKIIQSRELKIGSYSESANFLIKRNYSGRDGNNKPIFKDKKFPVKTSQVCCVADIPLMHLKYHSNRYGKFAIGFYRESIVENGFNPVLYTLENSDLSETLFNCQDAIRAMDLNIMNKKEYDLNSILEQIDSLRNQDKFPPLDSKIEEEIEDIHRKLDSMSNNIAFRLDSEDCFKSVSIDYLKSILSYVKTFTENEFESIYCEREWRSLKPFKFNLSDIALLVVPRKGGYYERLCKIAENKLKLPRELSINAWEDLIEH